MSLLCDAFSVLDLIKSKIELLFTHEIFDHADDGDYIVFKFKSAHLFQANEVLNISGVVDDKGEPIEDYNAAFVVYSIVDSTSVLVAKEQIVFGSSIEYNELANIENAVATNVRVYNDPGIEFDVTEYPVVIIDMTITSVIPTSSNSFVAGETNFPIRVLHRIDHFPLGDAIQLRACRYFVAYKLQQILNELKLKISSEIGRVETIWGSEEISMIGATVNK
jgi:hypothetical protein